MPVEVKECERFNQHRVIRRLSEPMRGRSIPVGSLCVQDDPNYPAWNGNLFYKHQRYGLIDLNNYESAWVQDTNTIFRMLDSTDAVTFVVK